MFLVWSGSEEQWLVMRSGIERKKVFHLSGTVDTSYLLDELFHGNRNGEPCSVWACRMFRVLLASKL